MFSWKMSCDSNFYHLTKESVMALVTVRLVSLLLEGSLVELLQAKAEMWYRLETRNFRDLSTSYLHTKCSGWNFLNIAVMQRPWQRRRFRIMTMKTIISIPGWVCDTQHRDCLGGHDNGSHSRGSHRVHRMIHHGMAPHTLCTQNSQCATTMIMLQ